MSCVSCSAPTCLPNSCFSEDGSAVSLCAGCREVLVQLSLGFVKKKDPQLSHTIDVDDMSTSELHALAKELGV